MLTNRDLNLLCRILEMRKQQVTRIEYRRERYAERFKAAARSQGWLAYENRGGGP